MDDQQPQGAEGHLSAVQIWPLQNLKWPQMLKLNLFQQGDNFLHGLSEETQAKQMTLKIPRLQDMGSKTRTLMSGQVHQLLPTELVGKVRLQMAVIIAPHLGDHLDLLGQIVLCLVSLILASLNRVQSNLRMLNQSSRNSHPDHFRRLLNHLQDHRQ